MTTSSRQVAVYWHLENMAASHYNKLFGAGQWNRDKLNGAKKVPDDLRIALGRARLDVAGVVAHARTIGSVVINRVYADWTIGLYRDYRNSLGEVRPVDFVQLYRGVPVRAELQLPMDVVVDLKRYPNITDVLICSGTVGFDALAAHVDHGGRRIHAVGFGTGNNAGWRAATRFAEYADICPPLRVPPLPAATVRSLVAAFSDTDAVLSVKALRSAATAVDPKPLGYASFWGLLKTAAVEGIVELDGTNPDKCTVQLCRAIDNVSA